jgi:hypothetical protein
MKKKLSFLVMFLMVAVILTSLVACASAKFNGTLDWTKSSGDSFQNNKQKDGSMLWHDNSYAGFDRKDFKDSAPAIVWYYDKCPLPDRNKWWQGMGTNDLKWDISSFTHVTITYKASRIGDEYTFTLSEKHDSQARECSATFTPAAADEWESFTVALADLAVPIGSNYQGKRYAAPTWSNINGWLIGAGVVEEDGGILRVDSIVFTTQAAEQTE